MTDAPKSSTLLSRVQTRLRIAALARSAFIASVAVLGVSIVAVLASRLLGLVPQSQERPFWLLAIPGAVAIAAGIFHRRVELKHAALAIDKHAQTKDLFLTLSSLSTSTGDYQPLVASSAEQAADRIVPTEVVPFRFQEGLTVATMVAGLLAIAIWLTPQLDPFGKVEAATKVDKQKTEIETIRKEALTRADRLKKEAERADEESGEIEDQVAQMKSDFRKMQPKKVESNARVLESHRMDLGDMWKGLSNDQLRKMMNQPISKQQLGSKSSQKADEWLKDIQEGKTEALQEELQKAQQTMQAMMETKDPEERKKLANQLQKDLQDLEKFAKDKAGSKELAKALSQSLKSLEACKNPGENPQGMELSKDAMEALKESLQLSEKEMDQVAQAAKDLKKLEDAMKILAKAEQLNQKQQLDGSKCEGCESLEDYAELYAQMMGEGQGDGTGNGRKNGKNDGGRGVGAGGESEYDDSDPEGYKTEKEKSQILAGKVLLSIKTKEYAQELDFDPTTMREYRDSVSQLKSGVQAAIESEEIPPGYVEGIKGYFDKIEKVADKK